MKRLLLLAGLLFAAATSAANPHVTVRVLELSAIGPDGRRVTLLADAAGYELPLAELGRIGEQVGGDGLPNGGYHTLAVRLADEYTLTQPDGEAVTRRFDATPVEMRVRGMVLVRDGQATPLRMHEPRPAYRLPDEDDDD